MALQRVDAACQRNDPDAQDREVVTCEACGLDYSFADSGDGPAVFIMFLAGFIVVGAALVTAIEYRPPYWVHAALWLPLILIVTLGPLRPRKGLMIALQYHHKAG